MSLKDALFAFLSDRLGHDRIHPWGGIPADEEMPYIAYGYITAGHVRHMQGGSGFVERRVQFDIYAATSVAADETSEAIREVLDSYRGDMAGVEILSCGLENEQDSYLDPTDGSQVGKYRRRMDFMIWHAESVPTIST